MSFDVEAGLPCMETKPETKPETNDKTGAATGLIDLAPVCGEVAGLLDSITDDQLAGPTPCPEYSVGDVLAHLIGLTVAFRDAAHKELGPTTDRPPVSAAAPALAADWRDILPRQLDELAAAWRSPGAWQGHTRVGGVDLPGAVTGLVGLNEVLVHGWDLARSTGRPYAPDEASLQALYTMPALGSGPAQTDGPVDGLFGPPVEVPEDAPLLDRVVGLTGRRPDWKPGA
ncbi:TIGR03086 family metal-binding protein [Streptomyces sp. AK02-01A]|uniref:TIGR03086 family metal-binding protein n=1 Tax=Streptomyces sp. AK02-01A TaxID=3028648 RepID=UPI0029C9BE26|nr:TIGR03086 family metal-binding protein [Streptomyces sp. AK02-01A]